MDFGHRLVSSKCIVLDAPSRYGLLTTLMHVQLCSHAHLIMWLAHCMLCKQHLILQLAYMYSVAVLIIPMQLARSYSCMTSPRHQHLWCYFLKWDLLHTMFHLCPMQWIASGSSQEPIPPAAVCGQEAVHHLRDRFYRHFKDRCQVPVVR